MTTLSITLLAVTITGLVAGSIVDFGGFNLNPVWTAALPFGAVFYGLFLISFMLEKEVARFDEDEAKELQLINDSHPAPGPKPAAETSRESCGSDTTLLLRIRNTRFFRPIAYPIS